MNEIDDEEAAFLAGAHEREAQRLRKYGAGFTRTQLDEFQRMERERREQGVPNLDELDLPLRVYNPLKRLGVLTVEGVGQILEEGRKPRLFGLRARQITKERYNSYMSQKRTP